MLDIIYIILLILLQVCFLVQLYYTVVIHQRLASTRVQDFEHGHLHPVSVIICARNEYENLQQNLPQVLDQDYPDYEVIVVNDCSVDASEDFLREMSKRYLHLKVVNITEHERFKHGKKFAVTIGIKAAKHEHLLFTDADCTPASKQWIRRMQMNFMAGTEIVLGFSPYEKRPGFLNKLIRYETWYTALNYFSFALAGKPYMGVGRNMAYLKSVFFRGKGFAAHMHIPSGDDDLFVNQNATPENTRIEFHKQSFVYSDPKRSFSSYVTQKLRHFGAGKAYKKDHRQMLQLQAGSGMFFYLLLVVLIILGAQWWVTAGLYFIRITTQWIVYYAVFRRLQHKDLLWWFPILDFVYYIYLLALSLLSIKKRKVKWK